MRAGMRGVVALVVMLGGMAEAIAGAGLASGVSNVRPGPEGIPSIPSQEPPVMVADASSVQSSAPQQVDRVIGVCHLSENPYDPTSAINSMSPPLDTKNYFRVHEHYKIEGQPSVSVLQIPTHGTLVDDGGGDYVYYPEKGYLGNDRATLLVELGSKKVRMEYFFRVMQHVPDQEGVNPYADNCPNKVRVWKISSTTDTSGNTILAAVDYENLGVMRI